MVNESGSWTVVHNINHKKKYYTSQQDGIGVPLSSVSAMEDLVGLIFTDDNNVGPPAPLPAPLIAATPASTRKEARVG